MLFIIKFKKKNGRKKKLECTPLHSYIAYLNKKKEGKIRMPTHSNSNNETEYRSKHKREKEMHQRILHIIRTLYYEVP